MWPRHPERRLGLFRGDTLFALGCTSMLALATLALVAARERDASLFPRHQWKVFASAAVFISGSHYCETQAFLSLEEEAEDTGCQGRKVTLPGNSSWLQTATTQLQLRPASCCTSLSISKDSEAGAGLGAGDQLQS